MNIGLVRVLVDEFDVRVHMGVIAGHGERRVAGRMSVVVVEVVVAVAMLMDARWMTVGVGVLL